jgi:methylated-DNA-[protein]-cysteine S-methyltransferase
MAATNLVHNVFRRQMPINFALFDTPIGTGGIAWAERGIVGIQLPDTDGVRTRSRLERRFPASVEAEPPAEIQRVVNQICLLLAGKPFDLSDVRLDMDRVPEFARRVYAAACGVTAGQTKTYGQIAQELGDPLMARDVGQALARNPFPLVVPCHRVLAAGGKLGGFSAAGGVATKQRLLEIERANVSWQLPLV